MSLGFTAASFFSRATVLKPDGSSLVSLAAVTSPTGDVALPALPVTGTYTILVDPNDAATGNITVTLSEDILGSITIGGAAVPVSLTRAGQRARLTFDGTAGQLLDVGLSNSTLPSGATASVLKPDGTTLSSVSFGTTPTAVDPYLPVTGTYTILIDPHYADTGAVTLTLSEEVTAWITPGGAAVPFSVTRAGQRGRLFFNGTAGQRVSVNLTGVTIPSYGLFILNPGGSVLGNNGGPYLDVLTLPTTGVYSVLIDPAQVYTGSATVTLYDVPADITGPITVNGAVVPVTLTVPGQQAAFTFSGTSGQVITARGASSTIGCLNFRVVFPNGGFSVISPCTASFTHGPMTLSQTGTFTLRVDPAGTNTGSVNVSVTSP